MVHFLKQRTKHLTIQILGILTVRVADVIELLEMQRETERERELYGFDAYFFLDFKIW